MVMAAAARAPDISSWVRMWRRTAQSILLCKVYRVLLVQRVVRPVPWDSILRIQSGTKLSASNDNGGSKHEDRRDRWRRPDPLENRRHSWARAATPNYLLNR
jgi:hypothetical protein